MFRRNVSGELFVLCLSLVHHLSSNNVVANNTDNSASVEITNGTATLADKQLTLRFSFNGCNQHVNNENIEQTSGPDSSSNIDKTQKTEIACDATQVSHIQRDKSAAAGPRRVGRAAWNDQPQDYAYNDDRQWKKLIRLLSAESKIDHENDVDMLRAVTKLTARGIPGDRSPDSTDRLAKRQPLDRLDEPSRWRTILKPKLGRAMLKRQPLDRIDEPNEWRNRVVPKLIGLADKRYPMNNRRDDQRWIEDRVPAKWFSTIDKRQPLDRLDEPSNWRNRLNTKLNRFSGKRRLALINDGDEMEADGASEE